MGVVDPHKEESESTSDPTTPIQYIVQGGGVRGSHTGQLAGGPVVHTPGSQMPADLIGLGVGSVDHLTTQMPTT
jgi:hypothetical protein